MFSLPTFTLHFYPGMAGEPCGKADDGGADAHAGSCHARVEVLDRTSTMSCVTFAQYADRMDAIARVFPVFFFLWRRWWLPPPYG